ncbi:heat shock 70 [Fusarium circinatum]|uniref:Heat shock 70 n=1 Tax=Fusarium circinatum TaxID=48490 RepID=A0A8H5X9R8_FUSCI|nr:heat shock 70 [Fusarium circinatum]
MVDQVVTLDRTAAIFLRNGSSVAVARVEGSQAYKDLMLRQNTTLATTDNRSNLQRPISDLWSLNKRFWKQPDTMEDIDKIALEPVLRGLKTAVEAYLGNSICFVKVALSGEAMKNDYLGDIVAGAVRHIGLVEVWAGRPAAPVQALFRKWQDDGDFGEPESLLLIIDNIEYGFDLALVYQEDGLAHTLRRHYHPYTGTESVTDKASSLQLALKHIMKPPFDYKIYYREVPQIIKELVIYGDNIWDPDFRNILHATFESSLIRGAYQRQPVYAPAIGLAENAFIRLNNPASTVMVAL